MSTALVMTAVWKTNLVLKDLLGSPLKWPFYALDMSLLSRSIFSVQSYFRLRMITYSSKQKPAIAVLVSVFVVNLQIDAKI